MPNTFILSDDSINKSGYRILTAGIDIKEFKKNPVMFYNHQRSNEWSQPNLLPIGKWVNIRKEDDKLLAEPEFDMDDEFAAKVAKKVEKGMLNAASVGIRVVAVSESSTDLVKGQTRPTITKSKIMEASIVDIPRNGNAMKLSFGDEVLVHGAADSVDKLNNILPIIKKTKKSDMKTVFKYLKLGEEASEADVLAALTQMGNQNVTLSEENASLKTKLDELKISAVKDKCVALVEKAIADKKLTASDRDNWLELAEGNYESTEKALGKMKGFATLSSEIESSESDNSLLNDADKYEAKWKADELLSWEKENPEEFKRCQSAYYDTVSPE